MPKDLDLYDRLMAEREGVLKWVVDGAVKWYREGLGEEPDACKEAYNQYCQMNQRKQITRKDGSPMFDDENSATDYIINNLEFTGRFEDIVQSTEVYEAYQQQCEQADEEAVTQTAFGRLMNDVQGVSNKKGAGGLKFYHGVKFKADEE
jgi:putative DNA primase/helicase